MQRTNRLFELIQILRQENRPITARQLAAQLEVSERTIYRDIAALQAMRTPIDGAAGLGYVLRRGYDLPPLNFDEEEIQALYVGLSMLARTGDSALQRAARRVRGKIDALHERADWLDVVTWGAPQDDPARGCVQIADLRNAIRDAQKLEILYRDEQQSETRRIVRPLVLIYHVECQILAAWCELRGGFRHFRSDRIWACRSLPCHFKDEADVLRKLWKQSQTNGETDQNPDDAAGPHTSESRPRDSFPLAFSASAK